MASTITTSSLPSSSAFSVDLLKNAKHHIFFLQQLQPLFIKRPSYKSLQRYRDYWLPLLHHNDGRLQLIPPPDIAWLWHCHRLAPFRYTSYLKATFGSNNDTMEADPPFCFQQVNEKKKKKVCIAGEMKDDDTTLSMAEQTRTLWNELYPIESFFNNDEQEDIKDDNDDNDSLLLDGFDLLESTDRQATFLWQVSGPKFAIDDFLEDGIVNYCKFLKLQRASKKKKNMILVPTYQIDLMWHTHILTSITNYNKDCKTIIGTTMNHDDSFNDRTEDGPLDRAFQETKALWKETYDEYYSPSWTAMSCSNGHMMCPSGQFLHLIGIQGASSTNPTLVEGSNSYDPSAIWCWKETPGKMSSHDPSEVLGDGSDCWIKYSNSITQELESIFTEGGADVLDLGNGYSVNFKTMKQINTSTGYERDIKRHTEMTDCLIVKPAIWCWEESRGQMSNHDASEVLGDGMIKYDIPTNLALESIFTKGGVDVLDIGNGYFVNFKTMKQINTTTGFERDVKRYTETKEEIAGWTQANGKTSCGLPAFIPAAAKATTRGENANPPKDDYIFGKVMVASRLGLHDTTRHQLGYYHISTKEAYEILSSRVKSNIVKKGIDYAVVSCITCGIGGKGLQKELQELKDIHGIVKARASAPLPQGIVGLRPEVQQDKSKRNKHYSDTGVWYFPDCYCAAGGGCGGGFACGAGCGGASGCGAGGCGAAGCGGGGCGGGGCGGGCGG